MSTIHIKSFKNIQSTNNEAKVQSIPCKIHADCDAKVNSYFEKYVKEDENGLKATFRGYPLKGQKVELPESYRGIILHESSRPLTEKEERTFCLTNTFKEVTFWNWDKTTSGNDSFIQALDWIDIAEALHTPIVEE